MRRLRVSLGLVALLALAGCGRGDSDQTAPTTVPPTVAPTTTLPRGSDEAATPFCGLARTYAEKSTAVQAEAKDPAKVRAAATDAESAIPRAQAVAPAAVKADVAVVARTVADVLATLRTNNYAVNAPSVQAKVLDAAFLKSFTAVYAYARAHCGVA